MKTLQDQLRETREEVDAYVPTNMGRQASINGIDCTIALLDRLPVTADGVIVAVPQRVYYDGGSEIIWLDVEMVSKEKDVDYNAWGFHGQNQHDERDWTLSPSSWSTRELAEAAAIV